MPQKRFSTWRSKRKKKRKFRRYKLPRSPSTVIKLTDVQQNKIIPSAPPSVDINNPLKVIKHQLASLNSLNPYIRLWDYYKLLKVKITWEFDRNILLSQNPNITMVYRQDHDGSTILANETVSEACNSSGKKFFRPTDKKNWLSVTYRPSPLLTLYTDNVHPSSYMPMTRQRWMDLQGNGIYTSFYGMGYGFYSDTPAIPNDIGYTLRIEYTIALKGQIQT